MARPTKLDDEVAARIADAVRLGAPLYMAARAGGVSATTLGEWKRRGRDGEEPFASFLCAIKRAEAEAATTALGVIRGAAEAGTWQAAAWLLERRFAKTFALRREVKAPAEPPLSPEDARKRIGELVRALVATSPELRAELAAIVEAHVPH